MIVNSILGLVYIDPPKTGSQTMDMIFKKLGGYIVEYKWQDKMVDKHQRVLPKEFKNFKTLATVRDPYRRALSFYHYDRKREINFLDLDMSTFKTYLEGIIEKTSDAPADTNDMAVYRHFPQWKYLSTNHIDHVIHLESIRTDLLKAGIRLKGNRMPKYNRGRYTEKWNDVKTPELIELVNIWAGDDFDLYGYEKETP